MVEKKKTEIPQNFSVVDGKVVMSGGKELVGPEGVWNPVKVKKIRRKGISRREESAEAAREIQNKMTEAVEPVPEMDAPEGEVVSDGLPSASVIKRRQDRANIEPIPPIEFDQAKG